MKDKLDPCLSLNESILKTCCNRCKIHAKHTTDRLYRHRLHDFKSPYPQILFDYRSFFDRSFVLFAVENENHNQILINENHYHFVPCKIVPIIVYITRDLAPVKSAKLT